MLLTSQYLLPSRSMCASVETTFDFLFDCASSSEESYTRLFDLYLDAILFVSRHLPNTVLNEVNAQ